MEPSVTIHPPDPAALNQAELDLWVACTWDARPARGLFDRCDWRLDGLLERWLRADRLRLGAGERCLVGAHRRLGGARLLVVGLGQRNDGELALQDLGRALAGEARDLGADRPGLEVPLGLSAPAARRFVVKGWGQGRSPGADLHIITTEHGEDEIDGARSRRRSGGRSGRR